MTSLAVAITHARPGWPPGRAFSWEWRCPARLHDPAGRTGPAGFTIAYNKENSAWQCNTRSSFPSDPSL